MRSDPRGSDLSDELPARDWTLFWLGDHAYFDELVRTESPALRSTITRYFHDADAVEELLQATWAAVFLKRRTFLGTGTLRGWMCCVARTTCLTELRRAATRWKYTDAQIQPVEWVSPLEAACRGDVRTAIATAMSEIPERQQRVVLLRLLHGLTTKETARTLCCPAGTVQASLHRARKTLQRRLKGVGEPLLSGYTAAGQ